MVGLSPVVKPASFPVMDVSLSAKASVSVGMSVA